MGELKPCPFCGCNAVFHVDSDIIDGLVEERYDVACDNDDCFISDGSDKYWGTKEAVISAWNRREKDDE